MSDKEFIDINMMGYDFRVACPVSEKDELKKAVELLTREMEKIKSSGKMIGMERIAMMAALSISHDYVKSSSKNPLDVIALTSKINEMNNLIDSVFSKPADRLL